MAEEKSKIVDLEEERRELIADFLYKWMQGKHVARKNGCKIKLPLKFGGAPGKRLFYTLQPYKDDVLLFDYITKVDHEKMTIHTIKLTEFMADEKEVDLLIENMHNIKV